MEQPVESDNDKSKWQIRNGNKRKHSYSNMNSNLSYKKRKGALQNLPTSEELDELREAEATFHSSLFRMQIEELMKEMGSKMDEKDELILWLKQLSSFLTSLPESERYSVNDLSWMSENIQYPIISNSAEIKGTFKFLPPTVVKEIGSFSLNTMCAADPIVDLALEIPRKFFQKTDYLNHSYHKKRALYLVYIAQNLQTSDLVKNLKFSYSQSCYLKPVLLLKPNGKLGKKFAISVTAYPEENSFRLTRFIPVRNNVRNDWYFNEKSETYLDIPTPHYNASVLSDLLIPKLNEHLKENISTQSVIDGIILLKVWSIQRGFISNQNKLSGFILSMFVTYLLQKKKISPMMSSYQVFRCTLLALQNEDLMAKGITVCNTKDKFQPEITDFKQLYDIVFVDPSGFLNICSYTSKETILMMQHEARLGIQILNGTVNDSFQLLFMTQVSFGLKFEHLINLRGPKKFRKYLKKLNLLEKKLDYGEDAISCITPKICDILKEGLKSRLLLLDVQVTATRRWPVSKAPHSPNKGLVTIGIILNPAVPPSNIEKGPSAENPEAKEFRSFWGEKSEIRRFEDGTIREAVYWPAQSIEDKRNVFCSMIEYILKKHVSVKAQDVCITGTDVHCLLNVPVLLPAESSSYGTGEEAHINIMHSFTSLTKQLRNLKGLPLLINSIQGISPSFRFSETFPPLPIAHKKNDSCFVSNHVLKLIHSARKAPFYVPSLTAIITFEGSGKWPDDADMIKNVKTAFYIKIAHLIHYQQSVTAVPFPTYVDILKDGFIFRFEIASHKEIALLKRMVLPNGIKIRETKLSRRLECRTQELPKLNSTLHGLHQQHNTYGTACRLAKRWLSSQLMHGYLHNVTVELIMAFIYLNPEPYTCPSLPQVAFLRFLSLLHTHDWNANPLIVNLNDEFTNDDIEEIKSSFMKMRPTYPPMTIITSLDRRGAMWTRKMSPSVIMKRLATLAKASADTLQTQLFSSVKSDIKEIFRPPHDPYDMLIQLNKSFIPLRYTAVDYAGSPKELELYKWEKKEKYPIVDYNPIELYMKELRVNFDDFAFFFYDAYGGDYIAVAFKPASFKPNRFLVSHAYCHTVTDDVSGETIVMPNIQEIMQTIEVLGTGFVKCIQMIDHKL